MVRAYKDEEREVQTKILKLRQSYMLVDDFTMETVNTIRKAADVLLKQIMTFDKPIKEDLESQVWDFIHLKEKQLQELSKTEQKQQEFNW